MSYLLFTCGLARLAQDTLNYWDHDIWVFYLCCHYLLKVTVSYVHVFPMN
jgi:hypothetical protein